MEYTDWGETEHDVIVGSFRHVFVPALPNEIVLLMQESVNAVVYRLQILIVREGDLGIISLEPHNFTDVNKYKSVQFDVTKDFDNVSLEDLSPTRPECEFFFMQTDVNVFVGTMPDCNHIVDGRPVNYATTFSCKTMAVLLYAEHATEAPSPLPYTNRFMTRYPLLPYVTSGADNFLPPCNCQ
ncbi:unnamed protein product [Lymnaea stagnalis]|uniref:Uncharacterized protein n=1 Tax=Lymnaea stagnalis TaxID=6523 RepID=A0AAV2GYF3_LYMST